MWRGGVPETGISIDQPEGTDEKNKKRQDLILTALLDIITMNRKSPSLAKEGKFYRVS